MELINDLGMLQTNDKCCKKRRYGVYKCPACGKYLECLSSNVKEGKSTKCRDCANKERSNSKKLEAAETFIEKAINIHGGNYNYELVSYNNAHTKVTIMCNTCDNTFTQRPDGHLAGQGCPQCAFVANSKAKITKAADTFINRAINVHGNRYDYNFVVYVDHKTKILIGCTTCNSTYTQSPNNHLQGQGCPSCAKNGFDKIKPAILYYLKITNGITIVYKIGITNRSVEERFNSIELEKITILKTWDFQLGADAYDKEQEILRLFKDYKYIGDPILSSGNTELFTIDVLQLDNKR